jgi:protein-S-isoprenylcysteine O-methyltransferase Ste14
MPGLARVVALTGAVLAAASLAWCAYRFATAFAVPAPGPLRTADVAWNAALLLAFAGHHSASARLPVRRWLADRLPPGVERSAYVWISSLLLACVAVWWRPLPGVAWTAGPPLTWLLGALQVAGLALAAWSVVLVGGLELAGLRPAPPPADGAGGPFTGRGPYGLVRHPLYTGTLLLLLPATPMTTTRLVFVALLAAYVLVAIPLEERSLRATAPGAWDAYRRTVPWRLLPGVY